MEQIKPFEVYSHGGERVVAEKPLYNGKWSVYDADGFRRVVHPAALRLWGERVVWELDDLRGKQLPLWTETAVAA